MIRKLTSRSIEVHSAIKQKPHSIESKKSDSGKKVKPLSAEKLQDLRDVFNVYDTDNNGTISQRV